MTKDFKIKEKDFELQLQRKEFEVQLQKKDYEILQKEIKNLEDKLGSTMEQLLRAKGLLTARGILEFVAGMAGRGFVPKDAKRLDTTTCLCRVAEMVANNSNLENVPTPSLVWPLFNVFKKCNISVADVATGIYSDLCKEVHGFPWSEESIPVYSKEMSSSTKYIIMAIAYEIYIRTTVFDDSVNNTALI